MPLRLRRKRILIISIISIIVIIYFTKNHSEKQIDDEDDFLDKPIKKREKRFFKIFNDETTTKSQHSTQTVREEFVQIDGKTLRKIDWHDYEMIARENARKGTIALCISWSFILLFFRIFIRTR